MGEAFDDLARSGRFLEHDNGLFCSGSALPPGDCHTQPSRIIDNDY